ncbi:MAG: hypothetical protein ACRDBH_09760 [Bosea sp. (in: a-proteobacteria)]
MSNLLRFTIASALLLAMSASAQSQQEPPGFSAQEQAACRPDAIRLCFFSLATSDGVRMCLRRNKASLSPPCKKLVESRGN